jgi:hypothetical protein
MASWTGDASLARGMSGAMGLQSSMTKARQEEGNEVVAMRGSIEHERRREAAQRQ